MRLSILPIVLAGAGLVQHVTASPIRVVVVTSHQSVSSNSDWGGLRPILAEAPRPAMAAATTTEIMQHHGAERHFCASMRDKAIALSNKFRETFGLPIIDMKPHVAAPSLSPIPAPQDMPNLRIVPYVGAANVARPIDTTPFPSSNAPYRGDLHILPIKPTPFPGGNAPYRGDLHILPVGKPIGHQRRIRGSFLHRVHQALMTLGPWEGRAVAFVLGCGIGVILRMIWVMAIVTVRAIRGRSSEEEDVHDVLVFEADAEDILVPPPQYTDEKVAQAEDVKA